MSNELDPITNDSNNEHFQVVLARALENPTRRSVLRGGLGLASMFALPMLPGCGGSSGPITPAGDIVTGLPTLATTNTLGGFVNCFGE